MKAKERIPLFYLPPNRCTGKSVTSPMPIQRSRKIKQESPNGLPIKYVGRPTKYGNPFICEGDMIYGNASHRRTILSPWIYIEIVKPEEAQSRLVELYKMWIDRHPDIEKMYIIPCPFTIGDIITELKDKNLSCWCTLTEPCHRNVLLEIANKNMKK